MVHLPSPIRLEQQRLLSKIASDSEHRMLPFDRQQWYALLERIGQQVRKPLNGWLAYHTAAFVLPIWEASMPHDREPRQILAIGHAVLVGELHDQDLDERIDWAYTRFGVDIDYDSLYFVEVPQTALAAAHATVTAIHETRIPHPVLRFIIAPDDREAMGDPWSHDTALWAVEAFAGPRTIWHPDPDRDQEHLFWQWWLTTAIEQAWESA